MRASARRAVVDALTGVAVGCVLLMAGRMAAGAGSGPPDWWRSRAGRGGPDWRPDWAPLEWPVVLAALTVTVGLALRRSRPRTAYGVVVAGTTVFLAAGGPVPPALVAPALCLWTLARLSPVRSWARWALLAIPMLWAPHVREPWLGLDDPSAWLGLVVSLWLLLVVPLVAFARREHHASLARVRAEELHRAAYEERLRVARDIHDVVGHSLSMISLQSGVALHLLDRDPAQARASLEAIRTGSKEALTELRRTLGVFRSSASSELLAPPPGLDALPGLVDGAAAARRTVRLQVPEAPDWAAAVSDVVQQAAYRIAQESVTNFVRHTRTGTLDLTIAVEEGNLMLSAVDDGPVTAPPAPHGDGQGLRSITERVSALGGESRIGPSGGLGWGVHVRLPLDPAPPARHESAPLETEEAP